jgi:putative Mn2+ efflux pump MntP
MVDPEDEQFAATAATIAVFTIAAFLVGWFFGYASETLMEMLALWLGDK